MRDPKEKILHNLTTQRELYNYYMPYGIKIDYQPAQPSVDIHSHSFIEIFYVLKGKIQHEFNGITSLLSKGDFALVDLNAFHQFIKLDGEDCSVINILFHPSFIDLSLSDNDNFKSILSSREMQYQTSLPTNFTINQIYHENDDTLKNLILSMQQEYFAGNFGYLKILKSYLISLLTYILRYMIQNTKQASVNTNPIDIAIDYINKNYYNKITLDELSTLTHYTPQHFCTKFKKTTGFSFSDYIQRIRINHSCQLLQHTNMKVTEIANAVGYQDLQYFELVFRKHINRTPMQHRQFCKKDIDLQAF